MELIHATSGRAMKFTPERIEQIRNLVERGKSREEIAELVGSTVGSLAVTCSRHGISLRRQRPPAAILTMARAPAQPPDAPSDPETEGNGDKMFEATLVVQHGGRVLSFKLPLTYREMGQMALDAQLQNITLGQLITRRLMKP